MRFGVESPPRRSLDLTAFSLKTSAASRWRHRIRGLDGKGRLVVPEAAVLLGDHGRMLTATLCPDRWELTPDGVSWFRLACGTSLALRPT